MRFLRLLLQTTVGLRLMSWVLTHSSMVLPVNRLHETRTLLAFQHPEPAYPVHILFVPKKTIGNMMELNKDDHNFLQDVFSTAQILVTDLGLENNGYRLILNGGDFQDFPYLHFHLISGDSDSQ